MPRRRKALKQEIINLFWGIRTKLKFFGRTPNIVCCMNREVGVSLLAISLSAPFTFPSQPLQTKSRKAWEVNKSHSSPTFKFVKKINSECFYFAFGFNWFGTKQSGFGHNREQELTRRESVPRPTMKDIKPWILPFTRKGFFEENVIFRFDGANMFLQPLSVFQQNLFSSRPQWCQTLGTPCWCTMQLHTPPGHQLHLLSLLFTDKNKEGGCWSRVHL